jgi:hypothetical protein
MGVGIAVKFADIEDKIGGDINFAPYGSLRGLLSPLLANVLFSSCVTSCMADFCSPGKPG